MPAALPAGYVRVVAGRAAVTVRADLAADAHAMLADGTLYESAARSLAARPLAGRGIAYAIALPASGTRAVVRHNRHGGMFAPLTRDLFLPPTRAPYELATSLRLAAAGVPTAEVLMYGVQRAGVLLRRADVVTREIVGGRDLSAYMAPDVSPVEREEAWQAALNLVLALNAIGARHHDLNVKNILVAPAGNRVGAWVLDVDRITFQVPGSPATAEANAARLLRSARKWRALHGGVFEESQLARLLG